MRGGTTLRPKVASVLWGGLCMQRPPHFGVPLRGPPCGPKCEPPWRRKKKQIRVGHEPYGSLQSQSDLQPQMVFNAPASRGRRAKGASGEPRKIRWMNQFGLGAIQSSPLEPPGVSSRRAPRMLRMSPLRNILGAHHFLYDYMIGKIACCDSTCFRLHFRPKVESLPPFWP
jgi:hypothetical protein